MHYHAHQLVGTLVVGDRLEVEVLDCLHLFVDFVAPVVKPLELEVETVGAYGVIWGKPTLIDDIALFGFHFFFTFFTEILVVPN